MDLDIGFYDKEIRNNNLNYCEENVDFDIFLSSEFVFNFLCDFIKDENIEDFDLDTCIDGVCLYIKKFQPTIPREDLSIYFDFLKNKNLTTDVLHVFYIFNYLEDSNLEFLKIIIHMRIHTNCDNSNNYFDFENYELEDIFSYEECPLVLKPLYPLDKELGHSIVSANFDYSKLKIHDENVEIFCYYFSSYNLEENQEYADIIYLNCCVANYRIHENLNHVIKLGAISQVEAFSRIDKNFLLSMDLDKLEDLFWYQNFAFLKKELQETFINILKNKSENFINEMISIIKKFNEEFATKIIRTIGFNFNNQNSVTSVYIKFLYYFYYNNDLEGLINFCNGDLYLCLSTFYNFMDLYKKETPSIIKFVLKFIEIVANKVGRITLNPINNRVYKLFCDYYYFIFDHKGDRKKFIDYSSIWVIVTFRNVFFETDEEYYSVLENKLENVDNLTDYMYIILTAENLDLIKKHFFKLLSFFKKIHWAYHQTRELKSSPYSPISTHNIFHYVDRFFLELKYKSEEEIKKSYEDYKENNNKNYNQYFRMAEFFGEYRCGFDLKDLICSSLEFDEEKIISKLLNTLMKGTSKTFFLYILKIRKNIILDFICNKNVIQYNSCLKNFTNELTTDLQEKFGLKTTTDPRKFLLFPEFFIYNFDSASTFLTKWDAKYIYRNLDDKYKEKVLLYYPYCF